MGNSSSREGGALSVEGSCCPPRNASWSVVGFSVCFFLRLGFGVFDVVFYWFFISFEG